MCTPMFLLLLLQNPTYAGFSKNQDSLRDVSNTHSPGRFPERKVGFPGRHPGSLFCRLGLFTTYLCLESYFVQHFLSVFVMRHLKSLKTTESLNSPGRKRGVSWKASWECSFSITAIDEFFVYLHLYFGSK